MPTTPLPENPDLGQLRTRARELQRAVRRGDEAALALVAEHHPAPPPAAAFPLSAAQTTLARRYGFPSWARLGQHVEVINARTWAMPEPAADEGPAEQFLRLAVLNYTDDDPARRVEAGRLLARQPGLAAAELAVAAACADVEQVDRLLGRDPAAATRPGGPFGWTPLLYLAYARPVPGPGLDATLGAAQRLLAAGADANDGRFFLGLPTPFTVLTGVFASDTAAQPAHSHAVPLARALLAAGADPNDAQTLYNRMFGRNDDHLELLFEFGLGRPGGGPWHRLLGAQLESRAEMLRSLLSWALTHDQRDRVARLAANGVDVIEPITVRRRFTKGRLTPIETALVNGHRELVAQLRGYGAREPRLNKVNTVVAAALADDEAPVAAASPRLLAAVRLARPGLIVWAAALGRVASVELLIRAGYDVNAYGRADAPIEQPWLTALHAAAQHGHVALARRLLELGADPGLRDTQYRGTALNWAQHFDQPAVAELLAPVTPPD